MLTSWWFCSTFTERLIDVFYVGLFGNILNNFTDPEASLNVITISLGTYK